MFLLNISSKEALYWNYYFVVAFLLLQDVEELLGLPPEKVLLKWMNFHLKKAGYDKQVTNFSSDVKVSKSLLVFFMRRIETANQP